MPTTNSVNSPQHKSIHKVLTLALLAMSLLASLHIGYLLIRVAPGSLVWLGAGTAVWPMALLLLRLLITRTGREVDTFYGVAGLVLIGCFMIGVGFFKELAPMPALAAFYALTVGLGGVWAMNAKLLIEFIKVDL